MQKRVGFTLVELLVVVLIVGILAAVALPQYQKAVEKSRLSALFPMARAVETAQKAYYMANGSFSDEMSALDISLPLSNMDTACILRHQSSDALRGDDNIIVALNNNSVEGSYFVAAARKTGPYSCSGIKIPLADVSSLKAGEAYCYEHIHQFEGKPGDFCAKVMNGTYIRIYDTCRFYRLP